MRVGQHLICQKVIVPYMIDADNDIMFTIKVVEMKFCMDVYGVRRHCLTIYEPVTVGNTKVNSRLYNLRQVDRW